MALAKLANKLYLYWRSIGYTNYLKESEEKFLENDKSEEEVEDEDNQLKTEKDKKKSRAPQKNKQIIAEIEKNQ